MQRPLFFTLAALVPLLLYARTVTFDFVRADDADLIAGNEEFLSDLRNVPRAFTRSYFEVEGDLVQDKTYYRPVAIVSFMLDAARSGANPSAYHLTNIVLHAAVTCLILVLGVRWGAPPLAALAAALVFAAHPVNAQAVAWIAGRNDLLLAMFGLLTLLTWTAILPEPKFRPAYSQAVRRPELQLGQGGRRTSISRSATTSVVAIVPIHAMAFALAVFSKETGVLFLFVAILHQRLVVRAPLTRRQKAALGVDAAIVVAWAVLRARALEGMPSEITAGTLMTVAGNAPQILAHVRKIVVPIALNVAPGVQDRDLLLAALALIALGVGASRYLTGALTTFAAAWVLLFLGPTLAVAGLPAYEHRAYVPLIGVLLTCAIGCSQVAIPNAQLPGKRPGRSRRALGLWRWKLTACAGLLVVLALMTYARQEVFRNAFSYWTDAARDPTFGPLANVNLGQLHEAEGQPAAARREYLRALERDPDTPKAHNNLGVVLMNLGEPALARTHFEEESRRHPWNADAWFNLGLVEEMRGNTAGARHFYERAIAANPAFAPAYEKLGIPPPGRRN